MKPIDEAWEILKNDFQGADFNDPALEGARRTLRDYARFGEQPDMDRDEMERLAMQHMIGNLADEDVREAFYGKDFDEGQGGETGFPVSHNFHGVGREKGKRFLRPNFAEGPNFEGYGEPLPMKMPNFPTLKAWNFLKEEDDDEKAKRKLIACLKKEGGAASLEDCCKACDRSKAECKKLINTMDNVKISPHGDVILMDGL